MELLSKTEAAEEAVFETLPTPPAAVVAAAAAVMEAADSTTSSDFALANCFLSLGTGVFTTEEEEAVTGGDIARCGCGVAAEETPDVVEVLPPSAIVVVIVEVG